MPKRSVDRGGSDDNSNDDSSSTSGQTHSRSSQSPPRGPTSTKRARVSEQPRLRVSTLEDLDMNILKFQNKKLAERLQQRQRLENDLRSRIEQLEKKLTSDESMVYVINRYWNQLNEDLRILLQRFDAETSDEAENRNEMEATTSFLTQLSNWDREELEEAHQQRVEVSTRAVAKVLQAFDRIVQRNAKITAALKGETTLTSVSGDGDDSPPNLDDAVKEANIELQNQNKNLNALVTSLHEKHRTMSLQNAEMKDKLTATEAANDELKNRIDDLEFELNRTRSREQRLEDHLHEAREKLRDLQTKIVDTEPAQGDQNAAAVAAQNAQAKASPPDSVSQAKLEETQRELEDQRDLAAARLLELESLNNSHKEALKTIEKLKMDLTCLPETVVIETAEYKCLQSHFSVLYNESMQLKTQLEDTRAQLSNSKNAHLRQIEHMESEELSIQKRLRTEIMQLEDNLAQVRREYEMLRIEFEKTLAVNEQTGPINREMRHLITSLQNHNHQLKGENQRYKRKFKESNHEIAKLKHQVDHLNAGSVKQENNTSSSNSGVAGTTETPVTTPVKEEPGIIKVEDIKKEEPDPSETPPKKEPASVTPLTPQTPTPVTPAAPVTKPTTPISAGAHPPPLPPHHHGTPHPPPPPHMHGHHRHHVKKEPGDDATQPPIELGAVVGEKMERKSEIEIIRELKAQLKKSQEAQRELKLLLDMYKSAPKDLRDKVAIMTSENKLKAEIGELKMQLKKAQETERRDKRRIADEDALRKIAKLEEINQTLQKNLAAQKQEEEALLNEMEVTGQAFEDMQEQNLRLIQQLREKDDANFKLMSEKIKSNQIHKLLKEEKEMLTEQVISLQGQVDAQNQVVRKLEEKERLLQNNLSTIEKELSLRQQAMELHKRKAIESTQSAADLKLHLEKYLAQLKEAQASVAERTSAMQQDAFKTKRLQEDMNSWRRKYERAKKFELAATADEVLQEEIKEYKEQLTCPSCKTKRKDAVLTKCFHVFCFDCLKTRVETRQRKCPKCNQAFGANDYHRLYLG